jgi:hypothetical protein
MKYLIKKTIKILVILFVFVFPIFSQAMSLSIGNPVENISAGDTVSLDLYINSEGKEINAVEGLIFVSGDYEIQTINVAGSIFNLWPNKPSFLDQKIYFVGGSTAGVFGSKLKLFSIVITPKSAGNLIFSSENLQIFLNDGKGTRVSVEKFEKNILVNSKSGENTNQLEKIISEDKIPPEDFEIIIGSDPGVFGGKYFASFNAVDNQSGLNRYEILEGKNLPIRSGNTYVLRNQNLEGEITINAIDNAGNVRTVTTSINKAFSTRDSINWFTIIIFVVLLLVLKVFCVKYFKKNVKK